MKRGLVVVVLPLRTKQKAGRGREKRASFYHARSELGLESTDCPARNSCHPYETSHCLFIYFSSSLHHRTPPFYIAPSPVLHTPAPLLFSLALHSLLCSVRSAILNFSPAFAMQCNAITCVFLSLVISVSELLTTSSL
jgi:hypothetical protein